MTIKLLSRHFSLLLAAVLLLWSLMPATGSARPLLQVGIGYNDQINKSPQGSSYTFEVLLTYHLLTQLGYEINFVMAPYAKLAELLAQQKLHLATRQSGPANPTLYYSSPYTTFNNQVFALTSLKSKVSQISDLKHYSITTFQNARHVFGTDFYKISAEAKAYQEVMDHTQAVQMLLKGRTQLLILDKNTFYRRLAELKQPTSLVQSFDVLPRVQYRIGFYQPQLQQQVDKLLQQWQASGQLDNLRLQARVSAPEIDKLLRRHQH